MHHGKKKIEGGKLLISYLFGSHIYLSVNLYEQTDVFWGTLARSRLRWFRDFDRVSDCDMEAGRFRWFLGGQINVSGRSWSRDIYPVPMFRIIDECVYFSVNCVDRHKEKDASRVALIWEKDEPGQEERVTYGLV